MTQRRVGASEESPRSPGTLRLALLLAFPAIFSGCLSAPAEIDIDPGASALVHRFRPGQDLSYAFSSSLKQDMTVTGGERVHHEMSLTGVTWQVVAEVDERTGDALIGWLVKSRWAVTAGAHGLTQAARDQTSVAAFHVDRFGRASRRELATADARRYSLRRSLNPISEASQLCAAFPSNQPPAAVGLTWAGPVLLPTPGTKQSGWAVSSVTALRTEGGARVAVIRSTISSGGEESHATWRRDLSRPEQELSGTTEGVFDLERGIWRQWDIDLTADMKGQGFSGAMKLVSAIRLAGARVLPSGQASLQRSRIKALDEALVRLYANDTDRALQMLDRLKSREADPDWRLGVEVAMALVKQAMNPEPPVAHAKPAAPAAKEAAPETTKPALAPDSAPALYQKAAEQAQAGNTQKAIDLYGKALAAGPGDLPPATRLLAQYRVAGLHEKLGQKDQALAAYQAAQALPGDDDYSRSLKQKAAERAAKLAEPGVAP